jgi:hypothetical protein
MQDRTDPRLSVNTRTYLRYHASRCDESKPCMVEEGLTPKRAGFAAGLTSLV